MRVQSPIAGAMNGAAGGLIFQHYHGRTFGRAFPAFFHYQPTLPQYLAQKKYYKTRGAWNPLYREIKPYIPRNQFKNANCFNKLSDGVFRALGVFDQPAQEPQTQKFGFDVFDRLSLYLNNWTLYADSAYYYITFWDLHFVSRIDFVPLWAHALYFCRDLQQIQYVVVPFDSEHLTFYFSNAKEWFPDHDFDMYVAISGDNYFSNFFF